MATGAGRDPTPRVLDRPGVAHRGCPQLSAAPPVPPLVAGLLTDCAFPPAGRPVVCAVSGGADSLALLVLAVAAGLTVTAVHVDHGLRPGSAAEADVVAAAASRLGAGFHAARVDIEPGPNLEARARSARRAVLPVGAMTGHTADDQAETVLLNLLRGAGLDGLAGIRPGPTKPILGLRRSQTRAACGAMGLEPVEDPSNHDPAHRRNVVRHQLMPLLDRIAERDVAAVLARQALLLGDEADHLDREAAGLDPTDARALRAAPPPLARRAIRRWLREQTGQDHPADAAAVERVRQVADALRRGCQVRGATVTRSGMRLDVVAHDPAATPGG